MIKTAYLQQREGETIQELAKRIAAAHDAMRKPQPEIISRAEAKAKELKYYFTGKPCSRGGIAERNVSDGNCRCDACRDFKANQVSSYREKNPNAVAKSKRLYREKNRDAVVEFSRRYYKENADYFRRYYDKNRDAFSDRARCYYEKNRDALIESIRRWRKENPEKSLAQSTKRRASKRHAVPSWFSEFDEFAFQQAYELAAERKQETGIEWHVDHMIPLRASKCCGLHCADNIQVIPAVMNLEKNNKMQLTKPLEWLR